MNTEKKISNRRMHNYNGDCGTVNGKGGKRAYRRAKRGAKIKAARLRARDDS